MNAKHFCLLLSAFCFFTAAVPLPREKDNWVHLKVGEFQIYSNASAGQTARIASELVKMREALGKVTRLKVRSTLPTRVLIFKSEASFGPIRDAVVGHRGTSYSGVFLGGQNVHHVLILADSESSAVARIVYHELTHQFLRNTVPAVPLWFSEGLAEYYSTFSAKGNDVYIGALIPEHVNFLRQKTVMPLSELFAVDKTSPAYSDGLRQGQFYAQSWALVHYLLGSDARREQLPTFLAMLEKGTPSEEAFRAAFQASYQELEGELRAYLRRLVFSYRRYSLEEFPLPAIPDPQPAGRADVVYVLGDLLAHSGEANLNDAEAFLTETLRIQPDHAAAYGSLGFMYEVRGQREKADSAYEKAIHLGSSDANVYILYGSTILNRISAGKTIPPDDMARARKLFERAVQLDANSARAYAGLGATYVGSEEVGPGIAALERSLSLAADQQDAAFNLVQLYARAGRRDDARRLVDTVLAHSDDPEMKRGARESLLVADAVYARSLLEAGNIEEAAAVLHAVQGSTSNERLRKNVEAVLSEVDRQVAFKKQADVFDSAVEKAKAGKFNEALRMVDEILPQITDADLRGMVQRFRDETARRVKK